MSNEFLDSAIRVSDTYVKLIATIYKLGLIGDLTLQTAQYLAYCYSSLEQEKIKTQLRKTRHGKR